MADVVDDEDGSSRPLLHGSRTCPIFGTLYQKPSAEQLLAALNVLALPPTTFTASPVAVGPQVDPAGVPRYLTAIVSSSLSWIPSSDARERIYSAASACLAERAGRSARPSMTRAFRIHQDLVIELREPGLTGDGIGWKTWTSSLLLARRLSALQHLLPAVANPVSDAPVRILELGAGTGLLGIATACIFEHVHVTVTDLPEIVANLQDNVVRNAHLLERTGASMVTKSLDWADDSVCPASDDERYPLVMAADPLYSDEHPRLLVSTVDRWLAQTPDARFIVVVPWRGGYEKERTDMTERLRDLRLEVVAHGEEVGFDDWEGRNGEQMEVPCGWCVWKRTVTVVR